MNLPEGYFLQDRKYRLTRTIGQGGFGITYLGEWNTVVKGGLGTMNTRVPVCIKEYFFKDYCYRDKASYAVKVHSATGEKLFDKFKEKLIQEAKILSEVHHPYIVNVLEVFEENNTAYIVMEYIKGCSLKYMLDKEGVLDENKVLKYTHQIGNALDFVHEKNIVHLDIKPSNILVDKNDNARLIDFGVSKRYDIEEADTSTTTLTLSKGFASIEQYDNEGTQVFSPCPDIYSLGATMYNILTGVIPTESILRATKSMLPPSAYNSNITPKTEKAILKAMEIRPEDRYQSIKEMLASIDAPVYDIVENTLTESIDDRNEEDTTLLGANANVKDVPDKEDDTLEKEDTIYRPSAVSRHKKPKRRKIRLPHIVAFFLIAIAVYALFDYFMGQKVIGSIISGIYQSDYDYISTNANGGDITIIPHKQDSVSPPADEPDEPVSQPQSRTVREEVETPTTSKPNENKRNDRSKPEQKNNATVTASQRNTANTPKNDDAAIAEKNEKAYQQLITSGKAKEKANDLVGAYADYTKAGNIKVTDEVITLMKNCKDKMDEADVKQRMDKYDFRQQYGAIFIVRDKTTQRFGAVDSKFVEKIPCKYLDVSRPRNGGRAFLRRDNKYDVFDENGKMTREGADSEELVF